MNAVSDMSKILLSNDKIEVYFKLYILLYADDTVILADSAVELQSALNTMFYAVNLGIWKLIQLRPK